MRLMPSLLVGIASRLKPEQRAKLLQSRIGASLRPLYRRLLTAEAPVLEISKGVGRGLRWRVFPYSNQTILVVGDYELIVQRWLEDNLTRGDVFLDVGSNLGFILLVGARLVGQDGRAIGFEPVPSLCAVAREQLALNGFCHGDVYMCALGATLGTGMLRVSSDTHSTSRIVEGMDEIDSKSIPVCIETLDNMILAGTLPAPNAIKVDAEGYEDRVLEGARTVLRKIRPKLMCEVHEPDVAARVVHILERSRYSWRYVDSSSCYPHHLVAEPLL